MLQDFAETLPGKSVLVAHQWGPPGVGRVYRAVAHQDGVMWLTAGWYVPTAGNEAMIRDIELGIASFVSIGFFAPQRVDVYGADGEFLYSEFRRGLDGEKAEAIRARGGRRGAPRLRRGRPRRSHTAERETPARSRLRT